MAFWLDERIQTKGKGGDCLNICQWSEFLHFPISVARLLLKLEEWACFSPGAVHLGSSVPFVMGSSEHLATEWALGQFCRFSYRKLKEFGSVLAAWRGSSCAQRWC